MVIALCDSKNKIKSKMVCTPVVKSEEVGLRFHTLLPLAGRLGRIIGAIFPPGIMGGFIAAHLFLFVSYRAGSSGPLRPHVQFLCL